MPVHQRRDDDEPMSDDSKTSAAEFAVMNEKVSTVITMMGKMDTAMNALVAASQQSSVQAGVTQEKVDGLGRTIREMQDRLKDGDVRIVKIEQTLGQHALVWKLVGGSVTIVAALVAWNFQELRSLGRADSDIRTATSQVDANLDRRVSILEIRQGVSPGGDTRQPKGLK